MLIKNISIVLSNFLICATAYAGYTTQDASGNYVSNNDDGSTTYIAQGADLTSWHTNTYRQPSYNYSYRNLVHGYHQNRYNPSEAYNFGRQIANNNNSTNYNLVANGVAALLNSKNQNSTLERSKNIVRQKYPDIEDPNSPVAQAYIAAIQRHPEYTSEENGPVLAMIAMENNS